MGSLSEEEFRAAMGSFASSVTIVTTVDDTGIPFGLTATAFSSVSKAPPTCLVCVARSAEAHPIIVSTGRFAVNVLGGDQQELASVFATTGADKFAGVEWSRGKALGCPVLDGSIAHVECTVAETRHHGDHDVFFGLIESAGARVGEPLLYFRGRYADLVGRV